MSAERVEGLLDEAAEDAEFIPAVSAAKLAAGLREQDPASLSEWLDMHAEEFLTEALQRRIKGSRASALRRAKARAFGEAASAAASGDTEALAHFSVLYVVSADNTRRRVGDMTGGDHRFVSASYGASGRHDLMLEAFHLAVAKKVGRRRTADAMTEEQYDALLRSTVFRGHRPIPDKSA
jgi:hypothetical protein